MQAALERTDRRRARTRAALLRAGHALFAARAVDAVSIDEIVAEADVAKGSFYNHFPDKEALARAVADEVREGVEAAAGLVNAEVADPAEQVARAVCFFARQAASHPEPAAVMLRLFAGAAIPDAPMDRGVRASIQAGLTAGRFTGLPLEAAVLMAVGVVQIAVARGLARPTGAAALAGDLAFGLLRGLGVADADARDTAQRARSAVFRARD